MLTLALTAIIQMQTQDYEWAALWDTVREFSLQSRAMTFLDHLVLSQTLKHYDFLRLPLNMQQVIS